MLSTHIAKVALLCLGLITVLLIPDLAIALLLVHFFIILIIGAGRLYSTQFPVGKVQNKKLLHPQQPFISIHLPCCHEPPDLLIKTLQSLIQVEYDNFEVIVLDYNTTQKKYWKPIQRFCDQLDDRFHFYHFDELEGLRAGALQLSRRLTNGKADIILVIEAGCVVEAEALSDAAGHFSNEKIGLLQFPPSFSNVVEQNGALAREYASVLDHYMNLGNTADGVLSTGSACFISLRALDSVGGWRGSSVAEGTELCMALHQAGYRVKYMAFPATQAIMPEDSTSLKKQRAQRVFGDMQNLLKLYQGRSPYTIKQLAALTLLLTAWFNFFLLPLGFIALELVARPFQLPFAGNGVAELAVLAIGAEILLIMPFFATLGLRKGYKTNEMLQNMLVSLGHSFEGGVYWWSAFFHPGRSLTPVYPGSVYLFAIVLLSAAPFLNSFFFQALAIFAAMCWITASHFLERQVQLTAQITESQSPLGVTTTRPVSVHEEKKAA